MEILHEIKPTKKNLAIALGYFDGVHIGHKKLLTTLVQQARANKLKTAVVTFAKNPKDYFNEKPTLNIQSFKDKQLLIESAGIDYLYELDFEDFKDMEAIEYIEKILVKNLQAKIIVAGYNHTFGKDKSGNAGVLRDCADKYNYSCVIVPELKFQNKETVSSSEIRKRIRHGHLNALKALLGRYFSIRNSVIKGDRIARSLGYPTANLIWSDSIAKLPHGVYYGFVQTGGKLTPALISWGAKPTIKMNGAEVLEAHLYDFNEDLYGKIINVMFVKKVRDEIKFSNFNSLKSQLEKDYQEFRKWAILSRPS